jgi:hypothetical protein
MLLLSIPVAAQSAQPTLHDRLIYTGEDVRPNYLYWWKNNLDFVDIHFDTTTIYRYIPETAELSTVEDYPGKKPFTPDEKEHYRAFSDKAFFSPDGNIFFYTSRFDTFSNAEGGWRSHLYAVGLLRGEYYPLRIEEIYRPPFIRWSENNRGFVVEQPTAYGGLVNIWHVKFAPYFIDVDETYIGSLDTDGYLYSISADGNRLLFPDAHGPLLLWDVRTPADENEMDGMERAQQIAAGEVAGAAFIPGDDRHILILNEQGIVRYDLTTQTSELLTDQVDSTWAKAGLFSPDNHYLAFLGGEGGITYPEVHVISLASILKS